MADIDPYLAAAAAHPDFKRDVDAFVRGGDAARIELHGFAPRVKVERVLTQLLSAHPGLAIERVALRARSGCSDFTGELSVVTADAVHQVAFTWCCAWRAEQEGWRDCFGFWDQQRAAREFGWDCFREWQMIGAPAAHVTQ